MVWSRKGWEVFAWESDKFFSISSLYLIFQGSQYFGKWETCLWQNFCSSVRKINFCFPILTVLMFAKSLNSLLTRDNIFLSVERKRDPYSGWSLNSGLTFFLSSFPLLFYLTIQHKVAIHFYWEAYLIPSFIQPANLSSNSLAGSLMALIRDWWYVISSNLKPSLWHWSKPVFSKTQYSFLPSAIPLPFRTLVVLVKENPRHIAGLDMQDHRLQGKEKQQE